MGECPDCHTKIGPFSILRGWDNWGKFVCPGCGSRIRFSNWLLAVVVLVGLMVGAERVLHYMLISQLPLWLSFILSSIAGILIMFLVPMIWKFEKDQ